MCIKQILISNGLPNTMNGMIHLLTLCNTEIKQAPDKSQARLDTSNKEHMASGVDSQQAFEVNCLNKSCYDWVLRKHVRH